MFSYRLKRSTVAVLGLLSPMLATAADQTDGTATKLGEVVVTAAPVSDANDFQGREVIRNVGEKSVASDASALLANEPGVAIIRNGPRTGIVQMRGQVNDRVNVLVDDMNIGMVNPNNFNPPLSNVMPLELETLKVLPGVTPVSAGGDSIAGTVVARTKGPQFGNSENFSPRLAGQVGGMSNGNRLSTFVNASMANLDTSINYFGGYQSGNDAKSANGTLRDTGYDVQSNRLSFGRRVGNGVMSVDVGTQRTTDTGNPAMAMDIIRSDSDTARIRYEGQTSIGKLELTAYHHKTDETSNNYSLRPVSGNRYYAVGDREDDGAKGKLTITRGSDTFRAGAEYLLGEWSITQYFPDMNKRMDLFNDNSRKRLGIFGEWEKRLNAQWNTLLGVRSDTVWSSAGSVSNWIGSASRAVDAAAFNRADRDRTDHLWDFTALANYETEQAGSYQFGVARKSRAPSLLERYLWSTFNGNGGIGDSTNSYFGNMDLKPEVANQVSIGATWGGERWMVNPVLFYSRVDNYIQGMRGVSPGGSSVLKYTNVDAELSGFEGRWKYAITQQWKLDGWVAYTVGQNLTSHQYLLQIAPLKAAINTEYAAGSKWNLRAEWLIAASQNKVAAFKNEQPTSGYGIVNLRGSYRFTKDVALNIGIENVGDKYYTDHTSGLNQVSGSSVPVNTRLPGLGRTAFAAIEFALP